MDPNHSSDLHEQISELRSRVIRLEEVLRRQMLAQKPEIPPIAPREFEPAATPPTVPPIQFAATPPASSLENKTPEVGASPFTRAVTLEERSLESHGHAVSTKDRDRCHRAAAASDLFGKSFAHS
jgi:hypothetical protein